MTIASLVDEPHYQHVNPLTTTSCIGHSFSLPRSSRSLSSQTRKLPTRCTTSSFATDASSTDRAIRGSRRMWRSRTVASSKSVELRGMEKRSSTRAANTCHRAGSTPWISRGPCCRETGLPKTSCARASRRQLEVREGRPCRRRAYQNTSRRSSGRGSASTSAPTSARRKPASPSSAARRARRRLRSSTECGQSWTPP